MFRSFRLAAALFVVSCAVLLSPTLTAQDAPGAPPQPLTLDLQGALQLARQQAPALEARRLRLEEARGLLDEASLPFASDPELELGAGRRHAPDSHDRSTDWSIALRQQLEPAGRRDARIGAAASEVEAERAAGGDALRTLLEGVAERHLRARHAHERRLVLEESRDLAQAALDVARRRAAAGDAGAMEEQLAVVGVAHAAGEAARAQADEALDVAELATVLGLPPDTRLELTGPLAWPLPEALRGSPEDALGAASSRGDLAELAAHVAQAEAEVDLAEAEGRPGFGVSVGYERDDGDRVATLGLDVGLPLFGRGGGLRASAAARASRLRGELAALRNAVQQDVRGAWEAWRLLDAAGAAPNADVAVALAEAERLARRRFEAGDLGLLDLLDVRRELRTAQLARLDRLLDVALAGLQLSARSGLLTEGRVP